MTAGARRHIESARLPVLHCAARFACYERDGKHATAFSSVLHVCCDHDVRVPHMDASARSDKSGAMQRLDDELLAAGGVWAS